MRILIKGAGDLATGVACRLLNAGYQVVMTEIAEPTVIRRTVAFAQAVYDGETRVEGHKGILTKNIAEIEVVLAAGHVPVIIDPAARILEQIEFSGLVDAILAKKNLGTSLHQAKAVIALGPGFTAGVDAHAVVETQRGHHLGRVIWQGEAAPNTGIPGNVGGYAIERLVQAPKDGFFRPEKKIGDIVKANEILAYVEDAPVYAAIDGVLRGILQEGLMVEKGMKIGDIDPRCQVEHCFSVSDKARAIGGGVLEALDKLLARH